MLWIIRFIIGLKWFYVVIFDNDDCYVIEVCGGYGV